jgi:hypothetical protein
MIGKCPKTDPCHQTLFFAHRGTAYWSQGQAHGTHGLHALVTLFSWSVLWIKPRASSKLGQHAKLEPQPQQVFWLVCFYFCA